jgi:hypothetical protein
VGEGPERGAFLVGTTGSGAVRSGEQLRQLGGPRIGIRDLLAVEQPFREVGVQPGVVFRAVIHGSILLGATEAL